MIRHNGTRSPKQLQLTRGFDGSTTLQRYANAAALGQSVAVEIKTKRFAPAGVAVLLRLFAESAPVELALLAAGIPYTVEGDLPFYRRPELTVLLDYARLARYEAQLLGGKALSAAQADPFREAWQRVVNRPLRYVGRAHIDACAEAVIGGQPLSAALRTAAQSAPASVAARMTALAADLHWLAGEVGKRQPAQTWLQALVARLGYAEALAKESGGEELGRLRVEMLTAYLQFAAGRTLDQLLAEAEKPEPKQRDGVTITTIFRAKGREWPVVFVPGCNEGLLPYERGASVEEERRLLYVAITRARQHLYLYARADLPLSSFLAQAEADDLLKTVADVRRLLADPRRWGDADRLTVAVSAKQFGFASYVAHYWRSPQRAEAVASIARLLADLHLSRRLNRLGLDATDVVFWQNLAGSTPPRSPEKARPARWSRTRRNSRAIGDFFGALWGWIKASRPRTADRRKTKDHRRKTNG